MRKKNQNIIIIGDSAFAEVAYEYFTYDSEFNVLGFSVEEKYLKRDKLFGLPVIPFEILENEYPPSNYKVFVAIVYTQLNRLRARLYIDAKKKGYSIVSYVSSHSFIWRNAVIGENVFIFEDNTIQPFVTIGNNVILWSGNHIGHHSIIKDHCFIASHVVISGFCEVGEYCFMGVNSTVANNIKIAPNCIIGAGAVILKDTEEGKVYGAKMTGSKDYSAFSYYGIEGQQK